MKRQFFSGSSVEQALLRAARQFGIDPERVAYTIRDKKHGFLKVRRRVVIEVDPASPERLPEAPPLAPATKPRTAPVAAAREVSAPGGGAREAATGDATRSEQRMPLSETVMVERAVREVLRFLRLEAEVAVERRPEVFEVEISRTDREALVDREGRVLQAMEYLVPRLVRSWAGQGVPVKVDCEGFRASRERELRELAARTAEQVRRAGTSQSLEPMHPADRRLVHVALSEHPDVETESIGDGYYKRIRVFATGPDQDETDPDQHETERGGGDVSRETWAAPFPR